MAIPPPPPLENIFVKLLGFRDQLELLDSTLGWGPQLVCVLVPVSDSMAGNLGRDSELSMKYLKYLSCCSISI